MLRVICLLVTVTVSLQAQTVTFEDLTLPGPNTFVNGTPFTSGGVQFNSGAFNGFRYSNVKDISTAGFSNQSAAYVHNLDVSGPLGAGSGGSPQYAVANNFFQGDAVMTFPAGGRPLAMDFTNTTYAYLSMRDGDPPPFAFAKKFGGPTGNDPDFFKLTIKGFTAAGLDTNTAVEFYLADYRFANNAQDYLVKDWTTVSLAALSDQTRQLQFVLESSDNHPDFGMNTPAYFAVDNVAYTMVPEPAGCLLLLVWSLMRRTRAMSSGGRRHCTTHHSRKGCI